MVVLMRAMWRRTADRASWSCSGTNLTWSLVGNEGRHYTVLSPTGHIGVPQGRLPISRLITNTVPLEGLEPAFRQLESGGEVMKILIQCSGESE